MKTHYELYGRDWYLRNKERNAERSRNWAKNNRKRVVELVRNWQVKQGGIYWSWCGMKRRCDDPKFVGYKYYGARGITYPLKWKTFKGFKEDMEATHKEGLEIDRIDPNGNYSKENCRWVTILQQARNKRRHIWIEHEGKKIKLIEYAEMTGMNQHTLRSSYYLKMPIHKITKPTLLRY